MNANWVLACLVLSPVGLALTQGDLKGELRFQELLDVKYRGKQAAVGMNQDSAIPGIILKVEGSLIVIADIYDRPTLFIYQLIRAHWG